MLRKLFLIALLAMLTIGCGGGTTEEEPAALDTQNETTETTASDDHNNASGDGIETDDDEVDEVTNGTFAVEPANSKVVWTGAKAIGDSHTGTVDVSEGSLVVEGGLLVSGEFVIDMTTIANEDAGGMSDRLVTHLSSDDFFGVETHPTATLVINSAEWVKNEEYKVNGDLTIKGITNPVEFTANAFEENDIVNARAEITIDRSQYDVRYGSGSFFSDLGDDLINDEIELVVTLVAQ